MRERKKECCRPGGNSSDLRRARLGRRKNRCCVEFIDIKLILLGLLLIFLGVILISCRIC